MKQSLCALAMGAVGFAVGAFAGVDKVYDPLVELGETELEIRGVHDLEASDGHKVKIGLGHGFSAKMFVEGYLIVEKEDGHFEVEEAELEAKFQLSEQGEYWADFGMLVELEKVLDKDKWELKAGPIVQKQLNDYVVTANVLLEQQFGSKKSESGVEAEGALQMKYRLREGLEPAIEYYTDENTQALGPVLLGGTKMDDQKLKWELGVLFGLDDDTADATLRWQFEWEFY